MVDFPRPKTHSICVLTAFKWLNSLSYVYIYIKKNPHMRIHVRKVRKRFYVSIMFDVCMPVKYFEFNITIWNLNKSS